MSNPIYLDRVEVKDLKLEPDQELLLTVDYEKYTVTVSGSGEITIQVNGGEFVTAIINVGELFERIRSLPIVRIR